MDPARSTSPNCAGSKKVAIITVKGLILGGDDTFVKRQIDQAGKDEAVKAIVLRIDSPGGTVSGSDYYYHHLRKLVDESKIPMVVSMGSEAASGGYYIAMAVGPTPRGDLRRAYHLDRLDRRDHPSLQFGTAPGQMRR